MKATLFVLTALFASGCGSTNTADALLGQYEADITSIRDLADGYVADTSAAGDVAAVGALQLTYQQGMEDAMMDLEHVMGDMEGCQMMGDGMSMLDESRGSVDTIRGSMEAMMTAHADHTDAGECYTAAEAHGSEVAVEVGAMMDHRAAWGDMGMDCGEHMGHDTGMGI